MQTKLVEIESAKKLRCQGRSVRSIAAELGVAVSSVSVWVRDVTMSESQRQTLLPKRNNNYTPIDVKSITEASRLASEGWSQKELAVHFGWPVGSIHSILSRHNITTHGRKIEHYDACQVCGCASKEGRRLCPTCRSKVSRFVNKIRAIRQLGGRCEICGWIPSVNEFAAMDFHHVNSSSKEYAIGRNFNKSWKVLQEELLKCQLLCSRCHNILHSDRNGNSAIHIEAERWLKSSMML